MDLFSYFHEKLVHTRWKHQHVHFVVCHLGYKSTRTIIKPSDFGLTNILWRLTIFNTDKIFITNSPFLRNLSSVYLYAISNILRYNWVFRVDNVFSKNIFNLLIYMPRLYKVYFNTFNGMFTSKKIYKILCLLRIILLYTPWKIVIIKMILCN